MPQDVFPETKLNISVAFQISDCFAFEGSNVTLPHLSTTGLEIHGSWSGIPFHKTTRVPVWPTLSNQTDTNFSYVSKNADSIFSTSLYLHGKE